jgi:hypothetical protein
VAQWQVTVEFAGDAVRVEAETLELALELARDRAGDLNRSPQPDLVDAAGARQILGGISQQGFVQLQRARADFPAPVTRYGGGRGVWLRTAVEEFAARR